MSREGDDLERLAGRLGAAARRDQPLGARTTYRVGGTAALMSEPPDEDALLAVAGALDGLEVPVLVVGNGSNLLVSDQGFRGLAVLLGAGFGCLAIDGLEVRAGAALDLPALARRTAAAGLRGLEWAVGVPGTVGGALRMNAGGHGSETAATLVGFRWVDLRAGVVADAPAERLAATYRHTSLSPTEVVVEATFRLEPGDPLESRAAIDEIVRWRRANQPGGSNAGSVFTNPPGDSAGRLIDACGLKGERVGTAEVSRKHANFIQVDRGGSADDVRDLIERVRRVVGAATGNRAGPGGPAGGIRARSGEVGAMTPTGGGGVTTRSPAGGIDPRIRQRREEVERHRNRRRWRQIAAAVAVLALVGVVLAALHTPWFGARVVTVSGSHPRTSDAAIVAAAGLVGHPPLISVDPGTTAERIESLPFIATALVHRHWPDGISISVTEREPVVTMAGPGAAWSVLDGSGRTLATGPARPPHLVVLIVHAPSGPVPPMPVGEILPTAADPGLTVARTLPAAFAGQVISITTAPDGTVSLALGARLVVLLGTDTDLPAKYEDIAAIIANASPPAGATIDVTVPQSPTVGP